jgi:hypothetical protein
MLGEEHRSLSSSLYSSLQSQEERILIHKFEEVPPAGFDFGSVSK